MEFVKLGGGAYVNLAHIAYVETDDEGDSCLVHFAVASNVGELELGHFHLHLEGADARRLLAELDRVSGPNHAGP